MGGAVSSGVDNDDLIKNLFEADYIRTPIIERIFRSVDRGEYILPEFRIIAYKDQAWRHQHLHLSAPCIYSEVMEGLCLSPGLSFLNMGSGTGYLSTMAGLILGHKGVNHGFEYYADVIQYAYKKLDDFKRYSGAIDEFDFCEPKFLQGNCLCLTTEHRYDRIYVGAACPPPYDVFIKSLMAIGGILVMPINDQLIQVKRVSESSWTTAPLLAVSFATLIEPKKGVKEICEPAYFTPDSLQSLCRLEIRNILRNNIDLEFPKLKIRIHHSNSEKKNSRRSTYRQNMSRLTRQNSRPTDRADREDHNVTQYLGLVLDSMLERRRNTQAARSAFVQFALDSVSSSDEDDLDVTPKQNTTAEACSSSHESTSQMEVDDAVPLSSSNESRQKIDSGIGDETPSEGEYDEMDEDRSDTSSRSARWTCYYGHSSSSDENEVDDENDCDDTKDVTRKTVDSPYTFYMYEKIRQLPLPPVLKEYLHFYRI